MFGNRRNFRQIEHEKQTMLDPVALARASRERKRKIARNILFSVFGVIFAMVASWTVIRAVGKVNLEKQAQAAVPVLQTPETIEAPPEEKQEWKEGWVKYNGKIYEYNDDLITFLFMGIDKSGKVKEVAEGTNGGQADALFLLVLDQYNREINIVGINRNTMTDIDIYNENGDYVDTVKAQIAVQHGFGNGVEKSCEYQVDAVRKLLYNIPIHGYAAINMKAIPIINDTVGGVNVEALSDVYDEKDRKIISQGEAVHLMGNDAAMYVRDRDTGEFGSADVRLARQKQYLTNFVSQAKAAAKDDIGVVSELYNQLMPYMTTDVTFDEVAYLAPEVTGYTFETDGFHMIKGETVMGEEFEEYYVDEEALYDLIIDVFYKEVGLND
ncbi:MAG: LCP family protein [Lachnospiraceae bacterium]|nr:LCP family protein [Lachnospiraceae bacterium]